MTITERRTRDQETDHLHRVAGVIPAGVCLRSCLCLGNGVERRTEHAAYYRDYLAMVSGVYGL